MMRRFSWLLVASAIAAAGCEDETSAGLPTTLEEPVGVHDVSVLFPLPEVLGQQTSMVGAELVGKRGVLFPLEVYSELPLVDVLLSNEQSYNLLRVVSARIDPCFPGLGEACQNQIRLVMQPVVLDPAGDHLVANDAAVHLFYSLTREEVEALLRHVVELRRASGIEDGSAPLSVHPALAAEGIEGRFARGFRDALLTYAGEENLVRVTFMALEGASDEWRFGGFDIVDGALVPLGISGLTSSDQSFVNADRSGVSFDQASVTPESTNADDFSLFLFPDEATAALADERNAAFAALLRIENPTRHSPNTVDCVTCHIAAGTRAHAEQTYAMSATGAADAFISATGSEPAGRTAFGTHNLRAFGIFGSEPAISQRAANETEAVVDYVNRELVGR
ncbi:MAG: hypothetical protein HOV80_35065 [Polyangiaceae bacterium]|nr:hypothetical protein [Polyangiaceae bacterium]